MGTTINPMAARYFNSPQYAAAASNIAAAFAPPALEDYYTAEKIKGARIGNSALSDFYAAASGNPDMLGVAADLYDPSNSYYSVDQSNATTRRGQDVTAATSRDNNIRDNQFGLAKTYATTPLQNGEGMAGLPPEYAAALGLPNLPPTTGAAIGVPAPALSEDQVRGQLLSGLSPEMQAAIMGSDVKPVQVQTPDGPKYATPFDALGQSAYNDPGSQAAADLLNYKAPDGREGTAIFDPNTKTLVDAATGQPVPAGSQTYKLQGADKAAMTGATTANTTEANKIMAETNYLLTQSKAFRDLLNKNPGILGVQGYLRNYMQDFSVAARDIGAAMTAEGIPRIDSVDQVLQLAQRVGGRYDPAFAQAMAYALQMAYADANAADPGGEVNVRELERNLETYNGGIAGNARVLAALDVLDQRLAQRRDTYAQQLLNPNGATPTAVPPPAYGGGGTGAPPPAGTTRLRFDAEGNQIP